MLLCQQADNEADAEDMVQQTFLYLFCNFEKLGDVDSPSTKACIAKVAEHRAIDILWGKKWFASLEDCPDFNSPHMDALHPLEDAVSQLTKHYRSGITLHYVEGYSTKEIAGMLGMKRGTVKNDVEGKNHAGRDIGGWLKCGTKRKFFLLCFCP